jgi:hypothetical protein
MLIPSPPDYLNLAAYVHVNSFAEVETIIDAENVPVN